MGGVPNYYVPIRIKFGAGTSWLVSQAQRGFAHIISLASDQLKFFFIDGLDEYEGDAEGHHMSVPGYPNISIS
jgi:hypothetical protein